MIFVTVGTQLPFDRMIEAVDAWASEADGRSVFAQIGPSRYQPKHIEYAQYLPPSECVARMREARLIVAHAGMGTILSALELGTPVLVMPRLAALGEHRNDHQLATARRLAETGRVSVAEDASALVDRLNRLDQPDVLVRDQISPHASPQLIKALSDFIAA